ncbi:AraC family transcriptional regulator [Roseivirga sp. E12]|uniref:helix-turn-helix domain-containing protein n=1 Tax=Roseivirga sp. E12 TaxID=2819237 RepID=UPI001ABD333E|nr:helix-turn-helix domain-containing protein [Roseivirga sp. E12]MBO3699990.1 AraC family transcriptional regulator [Roseivirga sp. E12]
MIDRLLLYFILVLIVIPSAHGQEEPSTALDVVIAYENNEHWQLLDELKLRADRAKQNSLAECKINGQIVLIYGLIENKDSSQHYLDKVEAFWTNNQVDSESSDLYGQQFLSKFYHSRNRVYLDSADIYLKNSADINYVKYQQYRLSPASRNNGEYTGLTFNQIVFNPDVPEAIKGMAVTTHMGALFRSNRLDSMVSMINDLDRSQYTLFRQNFIYYGSILAYLDLYDLGAAEKRSLEFKEFLSTHSLDTVPKFFTRYNSVKRAIFKQVDMLDSVLVYQFEHIAYLKEDTTRIQSIAVSLTDMANVQKELEEYENAEKFYYESMSYLPEGLYLYDKAENLYGLALVWFEQHELTDDQAEKRTLLNKVRSVMEQHNEISLTLDSPLQLLKSKLIEARYLTLNSRYRLAENELKGILSTAESQAIAFPLAWGTYFLADLYYRTERYQLASETAIKALSYGWNTKNTILIQKLVINSNTGLGKRAVVQAYLDSIISLKDEQKRVQTDILIAGYEIKNQLDEQLLANENLQIVQSAKDRALSQQRLLLTISLVGIILILLFLLRTRLLNKKNRELLEVLRLESQELSATNNELEGSVNELVSMQADHNKLTDQLSVHIQKILKAIKGLGSFIPELGKLNTEQSKYYNRLVELTLQEEASIGSLMSVGTILGNRAIDIRRVSILSVLDTVKKNMASSLDLNDVRLNVKIDDGLVFLADQYLVELLFTSLIEHGFEQQIKNNKINIGVDAEDGLVVKVDFDGTPVESDIISHWLDYNPRSERSYLTKALQIKDLMDGDLQYLCVGETHKISVSLNLIELKSSQTKSSELEPVEIDAVYDQVIEFLVNQNGLSNPDLNLAVLSETIGVSRRKVSYVINTREKTNFSKLLARLRVDQVIKKLDNGDYKRLNIAGIGYEAGFNSKSTFFSSFKEFVGCTPGEYVSSLEKKAS